ncbi:TIGR04222 domain-containing membrane protein [Streptomyces sp. NBC_01408]|uniref:TIGR04222 domain-containing membrane protein n=1 Tax=Streptomyces sp. NBC_01408 TaxID=2903855 RepID=UPI00224D6B24|nr:TIGR04222 domain-containing membrane protein [Streptomyces sp. NBC_01408]MCX4696341.1 TIGR04222 domain-containing membrane protein [Streptomyces sp. NBC_01408]
MNLLALATWVAVIVSSVLLIRGLRGSRPASDGPPPRLHDLSEAAFVAGGPGNVVDTALVAMLGDGRLIVGGPGIVQVRPGARAGDHAERAVLQAHGGAPSGWLYQVRYAAMRDPAVQETGDVLAARGLLRAPGSGQPWRRWGIVQAVVCALMVPGALLLTFLALALGSGAQVPFIAKVIPALIGGLLVGVICAARAGQRVTPAGQRALRELRAAHLHDGTPYVQTALFGLRGLRDPYLRQQLVPAARGTRLAAAQARSGPAGADYAWASGAEFLPVLWCAGSDGGGSGGGGGGSGCGAGSTCASGSGCGGSGGGGSSGSSCGGSSGGGSSCSSSSGSSCSSSSSS